MRKGSRWYSMEMGGITCYTGSKELLLWLMVLSLKLVDHWNWIQMVFGVFCQALFLKTAKLRIEENGKTLTMPFIGSLMNERVYKNFTNEQYHTADNQVTSENSILFEVDGPYKAMILPSSQKEGEGIKRDMRYLTKMIN